MRISGSDIHLLTVFDAVVRNGGFTAAQIELGLSQPTISNHITALEERLGVKLCQRGRRGFMLTDKGRVVHKIGTGLIQTLEDHSVHLAELKGNRVGQLRIAVVDCLSTDPSFRLPDAIARFTGMAPAVRIDMAVKRPQDILNGIMDGSVHIGVGSFDNTLTGLSYSGLYEEAHALYCGRGHPLFDRADEPIDEVEVRRYAWAHRGYWSRQRQKSVNPADVDRFAHEIEAQLMLVLSGSYLGLLPEHLALSFERQGRLKRVAYVQDNFTSTIQAVSQSGTMPEVNGLFLRLLKDCCS